MASLLKCQSTGLGITAFAIQSIVLTSPVVLRRSLQRAWEPSLWWVWGHCQTVLVNRRTESCPQIAQPQDSHGSSVQAPWFPRGHLAMPRDRSCHNAQKREDRLAPSEWRSEMLLILTQDGPRGQVLPAPKCQQCGRWVIPFRPKRPKQRGILKSSNGRA